MNFVNILHEKDSAVIPCAAPPKRQHQYSVLNVKSVKKSRLNI